MATKKKKAAAKKPAKATKPAAKPSASKAKGPATAITQRDGKAVPAKRTRPVKPTPIETAIEHKRADAVRRELLHVQLCRWDRQPRTRISDESVRRMADAIDEVGFVVEPLIARPASTFSDVRGAVTGAPLDMFEIIAGERRHRGVGLLIQEGKWPKDRPLPVEVRDVTDAQMLKMAVVENEAREELDPLDQAESYQRLVDEAGMTKVAIAAMTGRPERTIYRRFALLNLAQPLRDALRADLIDLGQAEAFADGSSVCQVETWERMRLLASIPSADVIRTAMNAGSDAVRQIDRTRSKIEGALAKDTTPVPPPPPAEPPASPPPPAPGEEPPPAAPVHDLDEVDPATPRGLAMRPEWRVVVLPRDDRGLIAWRVEDPEGYAQRGGAMATSDYHLVLDTALEVARGLAPEAFAPVAPHGPTLFDHAEGPRQ